MTYTMLNALKLLAKEPRRTRQMFSGRDRIPPTISANTAIALERLEYVVYNRKTGVVMITDAGLHARWIKANQ